MMVLYFGSQFFTNCGDFEISFCYISKPTYYVVCMDSSDDGVVKQFYVPFAF